MSHLVSRYLDSNAAAFSVDANGSGQQILTTLTYEVKDWENASINVGNQFNLTNNNFEPTVAGYYTFSGTISMITEETAHVAILKNGSPLRLGQNVAGNSFWITAPLVFMNGTTDVVSLAFNKVTSNGINFDESPERTWFDGIFVRPA